MEQFFATVNSILVAIDDFIWGVPLMVLILAGGILLTVRLRGLQFAKLPRALRYMMKNEKGEDAHGEVSSFGALCTALSATIGTGNIVGVATAIVAGGPGAMFWMWLAALFGMATKYSEGLLAVAKNCSTTLPFFIPHRKTTDYLTPRAIRLQKAKEPVNIRR